VKRREHGTDTLTIPNPNGGTFAPVEGIGCDGGGDPADALEVLGSAEHNLTSTVDATVDAGTVTNNGEASPRPIVFPSIAPIADIVAAASSAAPPPPTPSLPRNPPPGG
jgi:hypothetical protein